MDKQQAQEIIKETFENSFDKDRFIYFIRNLLNRIDEDSFVYQGQFIPDSYKPFISKYIRIGKFNDGENRIDILIVYLNKNTSIERARSRQRNFIAGYLQGKYGSTNEKNAALVAFVSHDKADWRFSLVKLDYVFKPGKDAIPKAKEEFTPARRWSFLVGENEKSHTAQSRLVNILKNDEKDPTLEEIERAFDIETVTKEFFLEYRELFLRTKEELDRIVNNDQKIKADFEAKGVDTVNFTKKLLGQIVFLYFLQKKGWFGVGRDDDWGTGSKHFLRELFEKKHADYNNFFNDILEPLFYEALRIDRSYDDDYYSRFDCKIPFLNGGLFDPICNYDWVHTDITISDKLFSNSETTKEGDTGNGILDIFDRYNFTVKEDEPLEKEVAIDPELLGKAYEKFNAIRSDNFDEFKEALKSGKTGEESKFNKKFGVYYTPREIVHYMCQQSLINFLVTELEGKASKEDIEALIHIGEQVSENEARVISEGRETGTYSHKLPKSIRDNAELIDEKLSKVTICDPAVGSGAFPVGTMSEIVKARNVLSVFLNDKERTTYDFKHRCIEHSLYGVDIDPGAVEIAKLRLWLSLIVDEEDIKHIKPLPNLDYKIVCGNSLLGYPYKPQGLEKIEELKVRFFQETRPKEKSDLRNQIDNAIYGLYRNTEKGLGYKITIDFKINFSEVFHYNGGFDVVIANPPYLRIQEIQKNDANLAKALKKLFESASGSFDIYACFVELGVRLMKEKGNFSYILPHKFFQAAFGKNLRKLISSQKLLRQIVDFGSSQVFESATTYTCLLFLSRNNDEFKFAEFKPNSDIRNASHIFNIIATNDSFHSTEIDISVLSSDKATEKEWHFTAGRASSILDILYRHPRTLGNICEKIFQGIATSADNIYFLEHRSEKNGIITGYSPSLGRDVEIEKAFVKPLLKGADVQRYADLKPKIWCIFPYEINNSKAGIYKQSEIKNKFPLAWKYIEANRKELENRERGKMKHDEFYAYIYPKNLTEFGQPKIITPEISYGCNMTYDSKGLYHNTKCYSLIFKKTVNESPLYYLALLNSKLLWFFLTNTGYVLRGGYFVFKTNYLKPFPITRELTQDDQKPFITLVEYILYLRKTLSDNSNQILDAKDNLMISYFEQIIDAMVYELYFEDEFKKANKSIRPLLIKESLSELNSIKSEPVEKLRSIFNKLFDKENPIRKAIFFLDSIEAIRLIEESSENKSH